MKAFKITLWSLFIVYICLCLASCGFYLYIYIMAPEKVVAKTYEGGLLTTTDGEQRYIFEMQCYTNKNKNGVPLTDFKVNYMMDENNTNFYSQGLQYYNFASPNDFKLDTYSTIADYRESSEPYKRYESGLHGDYYYKVWGSFGPVFVGQEVYNYASNDDFNTTTIATNPINPSTKFKIQLGEGDSMVNYLMKFKGYDTKEAVKGDSELAQSLAKETFVCSELVSIYNKFLFECYDYNDYYSYLDINFLVKRLLESIESLPYGTSNSIVFEFGDWFDYYAYDSENGVYLEDKVSNATKIVNDIKSYYAIKVTVFEDGAQKASDSLFGVINGDSAFRYSEDVPGDYVVGRSVKTLTLNDFDRTIQDTNVELSLKESSLNILNNHPNMLLYIKVDLDELKKENLTFVGFTKDSGLEKFKIYKCVTIENIDGQIVESEVEYADNVV